MSATALAAPVRLRQLLAVTLHEPCRTRPWSQARVVPPSRGRHQGRLTASAQPLLVYTHSRPSIYHWNVRWRRSPIANNSLQSCAVSHDFGRRAGRWLACSDTSVTSPSKGCGGGRRIRRNRIRRVTGIASVLPAPQRVSSSQVAPRGQSEVALGRAALSPQRPPGAILRGLACAFVARAGADRLRG